MSALPDRGQEAYQPGSREDFDRLYRNETAPKTVKAVKTEHDSD